MVGERSWANLPPRSKALSRRNRKGVWNRDGEAKAPSRSRLMSTRCFIPLLALALSAGAEVIPEVGSALSRGDFASADAAIQRDRAQHGVTPALLEAMSWEARAALATNQLDKAEAYARETRALTAAELKKRPLDSDPHLSIALGAAIEVESQVLARRGQPAAALAFLRKQLAAYSTTSLAERIQKNINLLAMQGRPAPALDELHYLGPKPQPLMSLKGKPVLLFFWAHWCADCKAEAPILAEIRREYAPKGLSLIAPTQRYGYVAGGDDATPQQELAYIDAVRHKYYGPLLDVPAPISAQDFKRYGASTTPTIVLIDRAGIVRLYHPGAMTLDELRAALNSIS